ncbi:DNA repair protein RecN [Dielma fastidiosa]|uniref:DNA repair protein RecN n=1 Tax=Dielma fastidiosa TaxID=1034346 RepID=A0AB35UPA0_9FIRM|nr:DNA repair protein RecN [Dielma fastidiosa]MDY5167944.1 DNA repair protein RecN [Dielma fastidiosa]
MLKEIYVKDFILIDTAALQFTNSMSAFTGETGAGKSLLIDAIALLKGGRCNASMVKKGAEKALVEAVFELAGDHHSLSLLNEYGFESDDNTFIVTREINSEGKSTARINHRTVPVSMLKEIMENIIDIHSQHDTQYLLNSKYHTTLLDQYLNDFEALQQVQTAYREYADLKHDYEMAMNQTYNEDDLEFLLYQVREIDEAAISADEEEQLIDEQKKMMAFEKLSQRLANAIDALDGSNRASESLYEAVHELSYLEEFNDIKGQHEVLNDLYYSLNDALDSLKQIYNQLEYDEERNNEIQERLFVINNLKRKYGSTIALILEKRDELNRKIEMITHRQEFIEQQEALLKQALDRYSAVALAYSKKRQKAAKTLEKEICKECVDLYLEHARFSVSFKEQAPSINGIDKIEFMISMNPGEDMKPLASVASGGELSRLMLGMKIIFTRLQGIETVIFDEIDTGVSGKVAFAIGRKMAELAKHTQVFCVTHLASVAACAATQYLVEKNQQKAFTKTSIHALDDEERIRVLAMIASNSDSEPALSAARELLHKAQS